MNKNININHKSIYIKKIVNKRNNKLFKAHIYKKYILFFIKMEYIQKNMHNILI